MPGPVAAQGSTDHDAPKAWHHEVLLQQLRDADLRIFNRIWLNKIYKLAIRYQSTIMPIKSISMITGVGLGPFRRGKQHFQATSLQEVLGGKARGSAARQNSSVNLGSDSPMWPPLLYPDTCRE